MYVLIDGTRFECVCSIVGEDLVRLELDGEPPATVAHLDLCDDDDTPLGAFNATDYEHYSRQGHTMALHNGEVDLTPAVMEEAGPPMPDSYQLRADVDFLAALQGVSL